MAAQLESNIQSAPEYHKPTAAERAQTEWGIGRTARTLADFAERCASFPERNNASGQFDDKTGSIVLGYN